MFEKRHLIRLSRIALDVACILEEVVKDEEKKTVTPKPVAAPPQRLERAGREKTVQTCSKCKKSQPLESYKWAIKGVRRVKQCRACCSAYMVDWRKRKTTKRLRPPTGAVTGAVEEVARLANRKSGIYHVGHRRFRLCRGGFHSAPGQLLPATAFYSRRNGRGGLAGVGSICRDCNRGEVMAATQGRPVHRHHALGRIGYPPVLAVQVIDGNAHNIRVL